MVSTYLSFIICNELFAVNVVKVLEVLQMQHITHVPNAPDYIKGIINFRGEIVPVFESRVKFSLPEREPDQPFVVIVFDLSINGELLRIGAMVDKVKDVISLDENDIKPVPVMAAEFKTEFLEGIYKQNDDFIMILNVERVFSKEDLAILNEAKADSLEV
jgi:purine-binding chemotaxis protein CheW